MHDPRFHRPGAKAADITLGGDGHREVLMPRDLPIGTAALVEQQGPHGKHLPAG